VGACWQKIAICQTGKLLTNCRYTAQRNKFATYNRHNSPGSWAKRNSNPPERDNNPTPNGKLLTKFPLAWQSTDRYAGREESRCHVGV